MNWMGIMLCSGRKAESPDVSDAKEMGIMLCSGRKGRKYYYGG